MKKLELSKDEILMLIQSLEHCLATCHNDSKGAGQVCSDCEAAKALRQKLDAQVAV